LDWSKGAWVVELITPWKFQFLFRNSKCYVNMLHMLEKSFHISWYLVSHINHKTICLQSNWKNFNVCLIYSSKIIISSCIFMSIITSWLTNMPTRVHVIFIKKKLLKKSNLPIVTYTSSYLFLRNLEPFYPLTKALITNNSFWTSHANTSYKYLIHMETSSIYRYPSNLFMVSQYKSSTISLICIPEIQSRY
jgi:hypothetical protein